MSKIVFASDFHLGQRGLTTSGEREKALVRWIEDVAMEADEVFFLGDIFDFWFEYKSVIPKGYTRFLGALARLADSGIPIHLFVGNHDMWIFEYFTDEFGIPVYREPMVFERQGKKLFIGHGDGLGPGDRTYKILKRIFNNTWCIRLFHWLHPSIGMAIADAWSKKSRLDHQDILTFHGPEREYLLQYCEEQLTHLSNYDYMIFGHRHLPIDYMLSDSHTKYINTGDWLTFQSYAVMENSEISIQFFEQNQFIPITNDPSTWGLNGQR
jgi:UDP-2,3-diacylglucosamine hydrolase